MCHVGTLIRSQDKKDAGKETTRRRLRWMGEGELTAGWRQVVLIQRTQRWPGLTRVAEGRETMLGMHGQDGAVTAKMTKVARTGEDNLGDRRNGNG